MEMSIFGLRFRCANSVDADRSCEIISETGSKLILAMNENATPVGCVHVRNEGSACYLGMLAVDVDIQRQGLGGALVKEAERVARTEFFCREMHMTVISVRKELIEWYGRRGYRCTQERKAFPYRDRRFGIPLRPDLEFVVLRKDLEEAHESCRA